MWNHTGQQRPPFADEPGPGQESVWDYPRPPRLEVCAGRIEVRGTDGVLVAATDRYVRILETASPPSVYLPRDGVDFTQLVALAGGSRCEWKGQASYWALAGDAAGQPVAWAYPTPTASYAAIADCLSFYPGRVACTLNGERVRPQPGGFYGGWITDAIVGPVKGEPGTGHW